MLRKLLPALLGLALAACSGSSSSTTTSGSTSSGASATGSTGTTGSTGSSGATATASSSTGSTGSTASSTSSGSSGSTASSSSSSSTGSTGSTTTTTSSGSTSSGSSGSTGGVCNTLTPQNVVTPVQQTGLHANVFGGGTIDDGLYDLTAVTHWTGPNGPSGPLNLTVQQQLDFSGGGNVDEARFESNGGPDGGPGEEHASGTAVSCDGVLVFSATCGGGANVIEYGVDGNGDLHVWDGRQQSDFHAQSLAQATVPNGIAQCHQDPVCGGLAQLDDILIDTAAPGAVTATGGTAPVSGTYLGTTYTEYGVAQPSDGHRVTVELSAGNIRMAISKDEEVSVRIEGTYAADPTTGSFTISASCVSGTNGTVPTLPFGYTAIDASHFRFIVPAGISGYAGGESVDLALQ